MGGRDKLDELIDGRSVLQRSVEAVASARVAIEQASTFGWERYVGDKGAFIGMPGFGASAPFAART